MSDTTRSDEMTTTPDNLVAVKETADGRRFVRRDPLRGFVLTRLVDAAMTWEAESALATPPPPGWTVTPRPPPSREMAHVLRWAAEWADLDQPGDVDEGYIRAVQETIGHMLACWLVQSAGWDCCPTADGVSLIPWEEAPSWSVDQWQEFLIKTAKENA